MVAVLEFSDVTVVRDRNRILDSLTWSVEAGERKIAELRDYEKAHGADAALDAAYQDMTVTQARKKHVVLLTDGKAPTGGIRDLVSAMIAESITVTTVGLGSDLDEQLLKMIADVGGGRYHAVADPNNLPRIFTKETEMIARAAAVEEWFPVTQVGDAAFLRGVDVRTAPYLHGYVSTKLKPPPAQELLTSDTGEPILARWRIGLGWTLAWTSDVKSRWAVEWLRWPGFERFWGQLVHEHMRQKHRRELDRGRRDKQQIGPYTEVPQCFDRYGREMELLHAWRPGLTLGIVIRLVLRNPRCLLRGCVGAPSCRDLLHEYGRTNDDALDAWRDIDELPAERG